MIEIPEWLAKLPKNACIKHSEFAQVLGITQNALQFRVSNKTYSTPEPDFNSRIRQNDKRGRVVKANGLSKGRGKNHWRAVTIRNHIRHLNRMELEKRK